MKIKYILTIASICLISNAALAQNASVYSGQNLNKRIERVEKDLRILNKEVYKNGVSPLSSNAQTGMTKAQQADMEIRVSSMEENLRKIKGEVETINYNHEQLVNTVKKLQEDIDFRFENIDTKVAIEEVASKPKVDLSAFKKQAKETTDRVIEPIALIKDADSNFAPEKQYKAAFNLLKEKKFDEAEKSFTKFIKQNPSHKLAGNAQYWLAETYYVRGDMDEAMKQFAFGYKNYKDSSKASDNLLKLGITLGATGRAEDACLTLGELEKNYSPLSTAIANRMKNEQNKLNCSE